MTRNEFKEALAVLITKRLNEKRIDRTFILECIDDERWALVGEIDAQNRRDAEELHALGIKGEWKTGNRSKQMSFLNFDARTVAPLASLEPVPAGWYKVTIVKSNIKPTNKGDGGYLELQMEITEGQYQGRKLFWNLNLFNPSQEAQRISYGQLSAICHVTGQFNVVGQDAQDGATPMLHNIPFFVNVVVDQGNRGPINNVKGCKDLAGNDPGKQANQPGAPAPIAPQQPQQFGQAGGVAPPGFTPQVATPAAPVTPAGQPWQAGTSTPPNGNTPPPSAPFQQGWAQGQPTTPAAPAAAPGQPWQQSGSATATPPWQK